MKRNYFYSGHKYWLETTDYDYTKFKIGDEVICVNDTIIHYASFVKFGERRIITDILPDKLFVSSYYNIQIHGDYYLEDGIKYKGVIYFDNEYKYTHTTLIQNHYDWMQRFILLEDFKKYLRKYKLERIL